MDFLQEWLIIKQLLIDGVIQKQEVFMKKLVLLSMLLLSTVTYEVRGAFDINQTIAEREVVRMILGGIVLNGVGFITGVALTYYVMKKKRDKEIKKCVEKRLEEDRAEAQEMKS